MGKIIDTHAHLNFAEYNDDRRQIMEDSLKEGIFVINVGTNYASSEQAAKIADGYGRGVWAAIGLHPENIIDESQPEAKKPTKPENIQEPGFDDGRYRKLAQSSNKVVAIGEVGLDYLRLPKDKDKAMLMKARQREVFKKQLALARALELPVIIHSRLAHDELVAVLRDFAGDGGNINGVVHCFTGNVTQAGQYYDLGLHFGLNGIIFKLNIDDAIARLPLDRILLETDCPYLSPLPEIKRNEPRYVLEVAKRVAQIRGDSLENIIAAATDNTKRLFGLDG